MFRPVQVQDVMTPLPQGIEVDLSLADAVERMKQLGCRHVPVMRQGELVGLLSERDLELAAGVGAALEQVSVGVAMTDGAYAVSPTTPLAEVVITMKEKKIGSALVEQGDRVVGIFTTTDALRLLAHALDVEGAVAPRAPFPSEVRERLLNEHRVLVKMAETVKAEADRVLQEDSEDEDALRRHAAELYSGILRHLELEDEFLVPLLDEIPVSGRLRAGVVRDKHSTQRLQLHMAQGALPSADAEHLARSLSRLCEQLQAETTEQEKGVLSPRLLHDDLVARDASGG